ncbi:MAG: histidine phosphatase family protein [Actinomycetota bacterium]|nr:histidine phosphatase family protein [Actinomycetota bacterium]
MSDVCTLYLIRHGTTTMNVENRYRGRRDVPLDAQGWSDAVEAARELSPMGLAAVYAGPLRRTINTAQVIADECRIPDVRILHGLVNLDYGEWEGMTSEEASMFDPKAFKRYSESPSEAACPNGERLSDAQERMIAAIHLIGERHGGEIVAAVTHAVMIRLAVAKLTGLSGAKWRIPVGRGSLTRFEVVGEDIELIDMPAGDDVD